MAYRAAGTGPPDVVLVSDWFSHVGLLWADDSPFLPVLDRLSTFSRLITFDKRGVGLSDPVSLDTLPTLEDWVDDVRSVLDTLEVEQALIVGKGSGGPMAILFAATHPERVAGVALVNAWARLSVADDVPFGVSPELQAAMLDGPYLPAASVRALAGEPITPAVEQWWQAYLRNAASPTTALTMRQWLFSVDVRAALPSVHCPTLVLARRDAWIGADHARYLADHIAGAQLVVLPGSADFLFTGDTAPLLREVERFVTGRAPEPTPDRVLATVLYTDVVDSTGHAARLGDREWRRMLDRHDEVVANAIRVSCGRAVKMTGDGVVATFDGPARAIRCAVWIRAELASLGLQLRAGLHVGELERRGDDLGGIAMHIGARIQRLAEPGDILVSRTVRDLVAGSGIEFADRGPQQLRGIDEPWEVYAVTDSGRSR